MKQDILGNERKTERKKGRRKEIKKNELKKERKKNLFYLGTNGGDDEHSRASDQSKSLKNS